MICEDGHESFVSTYDGISTCASYAVGEANYNYCSSDTNVNGQLAINVCPECEYCSLASIHVIFLFFYSIISPLSNFDHKTLGCSRKFSGDSKLLIQKYMSYLFFKRLDCFD